MKKIFGDRLIALFAALVLFFTLTPSAAFAADSDFLVEIGEDGTVVITGYTGTDEHVTVPAVLAGAAVESLGDGAFQNQEQLLRGDLDGNGKINSSDARRILRIAAKLEPAPEA